MALSENAKQGRAIRQINQYIVEDIKNDSFNQLKEEGFTEINESSIFINHKPDAIIYNQISKEIIGTIEWKTDSSVSKYEKALKQLKNYSETVPTACIFIFTDGEKTEVFNRKMEKILNKINVFEGLCTKHSLNKEELEKIEEFQDFMELVDENVSLLNSENPPTDLISQTKKINLFSLDSKDKVREIWQQLWLATGEDPLPCLHTFTELLVYKMLSDLKILSKPFDIKSIIAMNTGALSFYKGKGGVRDIIKETIKGEPSIINGFVFNKQDAEFKSTLITIDSIGDFAIDTIDTDFKRRLMEYFLRQGNIKIKNGQHLTPRNIIKTIWEMSTIKKGDLVFDPACGVGGFLLEYFNNISSTKPTMKNLDKVRLLGYDNSDKMIILSKANFIIHTLEVLRKIDIKRNPQGEILSSEFEKYLEILNSCFQSINDTSFGSLSCIHEQEFADVIVTNPPFVSEGIGKKKKGMSKELKSYYKDCGHYIEGMFVRYISKSLKKGGEAIVILPFGVLSRKKDKSKQDILDNFNIKAIVSLPRRLFDNTDWKTYILFMQKKESEEEVYRKPIFLYNVENVGFTLDADRIDWDSDLEDLAERYKKYIKEGADSSEIISEKCRIIRQEDFKMLDNWEDSFEWCKEKYEKTTTSIKEALEQINYKKNNIDTLVKDLEDNLEQNENNIMMTEKKLNDPFCFEFLTYSLGKTRKEYLPIDTNDDSDIPIYTAKLEPVAYIKESEDMNPYYASEVERHVSVASDGQGTAGKNIVLHDRPYYLNTSRISIKVLASDILPEYLYHSIQDIKQRYALDFENKCNLNTLKEVDFKLPIKLDSNNEPIKITRLLHSEKAKEIGNDENILLEKEDYLYDLEQQIEAVENKNIILETKEKIQEEIKELEILLNSIKLL